MIKKFGMWLILLGITISAFYNIYIVMMKNKNNNEVETYIENTSVKENEIDDILENIEENNMEIKEEQKNFDIKYTAILEIPSINLKQGVINNTKGFESVKYAISVDNISNYPDKMGNFILYAHSGTSNIAFFKNLDKVNINDDIYVYYNGIKYHYIIYQKYDVKKTGKVKVLSSDNSKYITLITCNHNRKGYQIIEIGKLIEEIIY